MVENQSLIPSHSYGYTAGAHYRLKSVPASLTLGGYDANRLISHDVSFELDPDQNPVLALNGVKVSAKPLTASKVSTGWANDTLQLAAPDVDGLYTIDSSTPYLWLPEALCNSFAEALGLQYNDTLQLYTFGTNATRHETLVNWNLTFTFEVTDLPGSSKIVSLALPYDAFDLQLSYPYPGLVNANLFTPPIKYFPLRKASNSSQYTIGRAFLQETYLTVDYERNNFSISQAVFDTNALNDVNLVDITRPRNSVFKGPKTSASQHRLGSRQIGWIAGVIVGGLAIVALLCIWLLRRRRSQRRKAFDEKKPPKQRLRMRWFRFCAKALKISIPEHAFEVAGSTTRPKEVSADGGINELGGSDQKKPELGGDTPCTGPVPARGHDLRRPVELPTPPVSATFRGAHGGDEPSPENPPPYPADRTGRDPESIGDTSLSWISDDSKDPSGLGDSASPSPHVVSPLTPRFPRATYTLLDARRLGSSASLRSSNGGGASRSSMYSSDYSSRWGIGGHSPQQSPRRCSWEPSA